MTGSVRCSSKNTETQRTSSLSSRRGLVRRANLSLTPHQHCHNSELSRGLAAAVGRECLIGLEFSSEEDAVSQGGVAGPNPHPASPQNTHPGGLVWVYGSNEALSGENGRSTTAIEPWQLVTWWTKQSKSHRMPTRSCEFPLIGGRRTLHSGPAVSCDRRSGGVSAKQ